MGINRNTAILLWTIINTKFSELEVENIASAIRFPEFVILLLLGERNVSGFIRINTVLLEGCKNRSKCVGIAYGCVGMRGDCVGMKKQPKFVWF